MATDRGAGGILKNPGFEDPPDAVTGLPPGWTCLSLPSDPSPQASARIRLEDAAGPEGTRCLLMEADRDQPSPHLSISQWRPEALLPEGDWTLSAWVKADPRAGDTVPVALLLNVHGKDPSGSRGHAETFDVGRTWRRIAVAVPVPAGGGFPWVALGFQPANEPGLGRVWVDDIQLEPEGSGYDSMAEAYAARVSAELPPGARLSFFWMPMRDGTRLRTIQVLPPGPGPFPVVFQRSVYTYFPASYIPVRQGKAVVGQILYNGGCLLPAQAYDPYNYRFKAADLCNAANWDRGKTWESHVGPLGSRPHAPAGRRTADTRPGYDPYSYRNEITDTENACAWLARQPWCNGRIGMVGGSGSGIGAAMAALAGAPNLVATFPQASGGEALLYWGFINGVRRNTIYSWMGRRGVNTAVWPRPTVRRFDEARYRAFTRARAEAGSFRGVYLIRSGWYDLYTESLLDAFNDFKETALCVMQIGFHSHGSASGPSWEVIRFPARDPGVDLQHLFYRALESDAREGFPARSTIYYYLLGDVRDPAAPGNLYRTTTTWPPAGCRPTPYYFHPDGRLADTPPAEAARLEYVYDPKDPVPTLGGATFGLNPGPADQRPLKDRRDILRFETPPLERPVILTGPITAELHVSTDAPDTLFTVKLLDVYPDGYQMILQDAPFMTRFRDGRDREVPMKPGRAACLRIPVWSVANAFHRGHRIAVHISSSNADRFEVHPNTWDPVSSLAQAVPARQTLHLGPTTPSHIVLPVLPADETP